MFPCIPPWVKVFFSYSFDNNATTCITCYNFAITCYNNDSLITSLNSQQGLSIFALNQIGGKIVAQTVWKQIKPRHVMIIFQI